MTLEVKQMVIQSQVSSTSPGTNTSSDTAISSCPFANLKVDIENAFHHGLPNRLFQRVYRQIGNEIRER